MSCTKSSIPLNLMNINHKNAKNMSNMPKIWSLKTGVYQLIGGPW